MDGTIAATSGLSIDIAALDLGLDYLVWGTATSPVRRPDDVDDRDYDDTRDHDEQNNG